MPAAAEQVLTVAQMQAAEQALIDRGETVSSLMQRAGAGAADWVWRVSAGHPMTVLCGPGNNGGDGYVIAERLRVRGAEVTVVAPLEPKTAAAREARAAYRGVFAERGHGAVLVDCLFGSGLTRPLGPELTSLLHALADGHRLFVAVDLPSGIESDGAAVLDPDLPGCDLTLALGAWKFAHWLLPPRALMGALRLVDIGIDAVADAAQAIARPRLAAPAAEMHKYTRGLLAVIGGEMAGAAQLAAQAAMHAGAGYVKLLGPAPGAPADLVVDARPLADALAGDRIAAVAIGPGLGRGDEAAGRLAAALAAGVPALFDAEALHLLAPAHLSGRSAPLVLTPHEGELNALCRAFGVAGDARRERVRGLAGETGAVVVAKGPDTLVAAPDGRLAISPPAPSWLSTAGTGDVLAGIVASRLATGEEAFAAACQGVWLHGAAARLAGPAFAAGELAGTVAAAYAACL